MHGITSGWFNGVNPIDTLEINKHIALLRQELSKGQFFESRVERYLLNNPHTLTSVMKPEETYTANLVAEEQRRLASKVETLTEADRADIAEQGRVLLSSQDKVEDLSCLPTLRMSDIAPKLKRTVLEHTGLVNTPVQWRTTMTNGITYFKSISTLPPLGDDLKMYLPLFCDASIIGLFPEKY